MDKSWLRRLLGFGLLATMAFAMTPAGQAHADVDEYRRQASTYYSLTTTIWQPGEVTCSAYGWIGQNYNGGIEAYTSVSCPSGFWATAAWVKISDNYLGASPFVNVSSSCQASYCSKFASMAGGYGRTYCLLSVGFGQSGGARNGSSYVCIYT